MSCRIHVIVQHGDNVDQSGIDDSVIKDVYRSAYSLAGEGAPGESNMEAADTGQEVRAFARRRPERVGRNFLHRISECEGISASCIGSPLFGARGKYVRDVYLGWDGKAKPRHLSVRSWSMAPLDRLGLSRGSLPRL